MATLVRRRDPEQARRAVLYVHGWNDYFFQTHTADFFAERGYAFYALDLRRYGRSMREGQYGGYIGDLDDYFRELDLAAAEIHRRHRSLTIMAHSTGGLVTSLWAAQRLGIVDGLLLNSPWLAMQGSDLVQAVGAQIMAGLGSVLSTNALPVKDTGLYARAMHASQDGEWDYDLTLKTSPSQPIRAGWMRAILAGHQRIMTGLDIEVPVLVMCSTRSVVRRTWDPVLQECDSVLNADQIARRAHKLGSVVTIVRIEQGVHDLVLSRAPVRERVFAEMDRWLGAYSPGEDDDD